jgi:ribosomal protein S18 acetylase RimI-like enzyme
MVNAMRKRQLENSMTIIPMSIGDYQQVHAIWTSCPGMGLNDVDDGLDGFARFLKRNPTTCFIAVSNGESENPRHAVGVILAGNDGRRGYIYHTAVLPEYRHRGIAGKLVEAVCSAMTLLRIAKVALVVFASNDAGNTFWERQGFTVRTDLTYRNLALRDIKPMDT